MLRLPEHELEPERASKRRKCQHVEPLPVPYIFESNTDTYTHTFTNNVGDDLEQVAYNSSADCYWDENDTWYLFGSWWWSEKSGWWTS